jgi:Uncharacterized conserved protein
MIANIITQKIGEALKAHDEVRLSTLRMLSSAFNYEKIAKQHDLSDEEELSVIRKEAKKRKDAIESYSKVGEADKERANEKIEQEKKELEILQEYLPAEMGESELSDLVDSVIKELGISDIKDMGRVIGMVKAKSGGRAEGSKIAEFVKLALGS